MKKMWKLVSLLLVCVLLFTGCEMVGVFQDAMEGVNNPGQPKSFTNGGITLALTTDFMDFTDTSMNTEDYLFLYASEDIGIVCVQEDKAELFAEFDTMDLEGYANLILEINAIDSTVEKMNGIFTFSYIAGTETFICAFFESEDSFYNIQGYCETGIFQEKQDLIWQYISSAEFA